MKKLFLPIAVCSFIFFNGCSWREHFLVTNSTDMDVIVEYELDTSKAGSPIFENYPTGYQTYNSGEIKWDKPIKIKDEDTSKYTVRVVLSPRTAIIFGTLYNDHYKKYDQHFINARRFNLKRLLIQKGEFSKEMSPETFDDNVIKKHGMIMINTK